MNKRIFTLLCWMLLTLPMLAQNGSVRGTITDKETGESIISATVRLVGTDYGTVTDLDGFFALGNVPPGDYRLLATYIGYDSVSVDIKLSPGGINFQRIAMSEGGVTLGEISISGKRTAAKTEVQISSVRISTRDIKALPSTGGEPDIAQYLSVLPGVVFSGDQGGQLYIRGGSPVQNKILLDGLTIYKPFHSIGFFSVFETETIKNVDVLTGGFNAEYGGRISAIVDIKTREGNKKNFGGVVSANPFTAKALLEGPITKLKDNGSSSSFMITGKHSYLNETSKLFYNYAVQDTTGSLPFSFTDLYGKASFSFGGGSKLNLFGFNFNDDVVYTGLATLGWKTVGGGANFKLVPPNSNLIIDGLVGYSKYNINLDEEVDKPRTSSISSTTAKINFTYFGNKTEFKYGFSFTSLNTNLEFVNLFDRTFVQEDFPSEIAGFFKYKQIIGNLVFEPSVRLQFYNSSPSDFEIEPRLGLKYNVNEGFRLKAAGGMYSQNLLSTVNERDVVNLFVGFITGPDENVFKLNTDEEVDHRLQKSIHAVLGFEYDITQQIELNVEGYYKDYPQLIGINRNKQTAEEPDYVTETGEAYGVDFLLKYNSEDWYLWGTYSMGYVNRFDGEQIYPTVFDRRHNVNLLATYNFGSDRSWEASARWNMGSGFPFTQTQGFYGNQELGDGISSNIITNNPNLGIIYDEKRNGGRLPYFHRLDVSLKKTIEFSKTSNLVVTLSATNAYNRENIFFVDRITTNRVNQLPILPSLGAVFSF